MSSSAPTNNVDVEPPRKRRRFYKGYCDATNPCMDVPRTTQWNIENFETKSSAVNTEERRGEDQQHKDNSDDADPGSSPDTSSHGDSGGEGSDDNDIEFEHSFQSEGSHRASSTHQHHNIGPLAANKDDADPSSSPDISSHGDSGGEGSDDNDIEFEHSFQSEGLHRGSYTHQHCNMRPLAANKDDADPSSSPDDDSSGEDNPNHHQHQNIQQDQPPPLPPSHNNLRCKLRGEYSGRIEDQVAASRGEVLLNIQEFCRQHPLPLTAQEDLHKLVNSMFYKPVIPETTYKLDKLYSSATKISYHFYCSKCFSGFGELDYKVVRVYICNECQTESIVYDLTKASFFIIIEFVDQLQLLLQDPEISFALKNPNEFPDNGDLMRDLYDGSVYKNFVASLDFSNGLNYLSFSACTDGTPVYDSSTLSIWPIFISVNELPPHIRMSNVLLAGLWFGKCHPQMDLFLEPFSDYIVSLSVQGFSLNVHGEVKPYQGYLLDMCVDSGARGSVQSIHSHNGESSCNWCLHPGEVEGGGSNARKFLQYNIEPAKRTVQQMVKDGEAVLKLPGKNNHINGITGLSPLLRCPKFDIVEGMILDTLHWASFGVSRRMGKLWLGLTKKKNRKKGTENVVEDDNLMPDYYVGTDETMAIINSRICGLRLPLEVRRVPRDLSQVHDFNAREWENWALYFSVHLFKNILPERFLKHWTLFVQAFYLLMKSNLRKTEVNVAGILMKMYVDGVLELYGKQELNFNMHISNHAADNSLRWGNAWGISTYAFENGNKILKSKIHGERGIPHQLIRSLKRECALSVLRAEASTAQTDVFRKSMARKDVKKSFYAGSVRCMMSRDFNPSREELWLCQQEGIDAGDFLQCTRIIHNSVCYASDKGSKTDNSFVFCVDGKIVKIRNIIADERSGVVFLFVSKVRYRPYPLPALPRAVTSVNFSPFLYTVDLIEEGTSITSCDNLATICVHMKVDCRFYKGNFLSVMANTSNVF